MEQEELNKLNLGAIDFTPDWAKRDAGVSVGKIKPMREMGSRKPNMGEGKARNKPFVRKAHYEERVRPIDAEVKILPETKALGTIIRKLQNDFHAYKLKELAYFFMDNPQSILLKVTPKGEERFYQCKVCGFASNKQEDVIEHVLNAHLGDYYDSQEVECEPPKGNFNCVAKCGLSGVLLGPPNLHEFNATVREMIRTRYPEMTEEQYRAHIEMVRDSEVIEQWRAGAVKRTVFTAKGEGEDKVQLTREQAEGEFRRMMLPSLIETPKNLMITYDVAIKSPVKGLVWAVKDAVEAERRAPYNMCFALRGAFHHRKMKFFRVNDARGPEFVTNVEYKEFDASHAIPELAEASKFVAEHPCCDRKELPEGMVKHLEWLVSTGHVVAFTNGVYSQVEKYPKYGPQWKKRATVKKEVSAEAETPVVEEKAVEAPIVEEKAEAVVPAAVEVPVVEEKAEEKKDENSAELA